MVEDQLIAPSPRRKTNGKRRRSFRNEPGIEKEALMCPFSSLTLRGGSSPKL